MEIKEMASSLGSPSMGYLNPKVSQSSVAHWDV